MERGAHMRVPLRDKKKIVKDVCYVKLLLAAQSLVFFLQPFIFFAQALVFISQLSYFRVLLSPLSAADKRILSKLPILGAPPVNRLLRNTVFLRQRLYADAFFSV
jgi:hypothetical protein